MDKTSPKKIDSIIKDNYQKNPDVGISVGFINNDKEYYTAYGKLNKESKIDINKNSIFEIASITKILTSNLIAQAGLTGHSFGGFETDYIVAKTDRFAAAVSGAAVTNLVSGYLYYNTDSASPNFFRFENHQQRMGKSLFEDLSSYLRNSPVLQAEGVNTPLLAWVGEEDKQVYYFQSIEYYLALRRLKKEHTLLIYPGESHTIIDKKNQADLTKRIEVWFAKYLKP